jgi:hypothetical protein
VAEPTNPGRRPFGWPWLHWLALALACLALTGLAASAPATTDLAGPVFGAAATFAALFLPAAGLVSAYVTDRLPGLEGTLVAHARTGDPTHATAVRNIVQRVIQALEGLPTAFGLYIAAFGLASVALLHTDPHQLRYHHGGHVLDLPAVVIGVAIAFDLAATCKLLPLARLLLDRANLTAVYNASVFLAEQPPADHADKPATSTNSTTSDSIRQDGDPPEPPGPT